MRYLIRKDVISPVPEIDISADEYTRLERARAVLANAFSIEEKYEILVSNFLELEKQLLHLAVTNAVRDTLSYSEFFETRSVLNICLVNLLTAARLYLDQLPQDISECIPENIAAVRLVKNRCSKEYDECLEYRFMEALRNHVQHRGIPIHSISQGAHWTSFKEDGLMEYSVDILAQKRYLAEDRQFKKKILAELPDEVDLKAACRRYVEGLSAIHQFARELIAEATSAARDAIEVMHKRYAGVCSESLVGLAAFALSDGVKRSFVPLLLEWDDVRIELQKRNAQLVNLSKRYATGLAGGKH